MTQVGAFAKTCPLGVVARPRLMVGVAQPISSCCLAFAYFSSRRARSAGSKRARRAGSVLSARSAALTFSAMGLALTRAY